MAEKMYALNVPCIVGNKSGLLETKQNTNSLTITMTAMHLATAQWQLISFNQTRARSKC